jgi:hypothetical protein
LVFTSLVFFQAQIIAVSRILPYLKEGVDPCGTWPVGFNQDRSLKE